MPIFEISSGNCVIRADDRDSACMAFAEYVGGDLGIECFNVKELDETKIDEDEIDYEG